MRIPTPSSTIKCLHYFHHILHQCITNIIYWGWHVLSPIRTNAQYVRFVRIELKFSFLTKKWVAQPNTYEWLWLSKSYRYWSSSLWKFISSLRTTRPTAISSKDNSTHGNFVQGQLDPWQFRPRTTRPTAISSKDNSTHGNFVQGQLDPRQFRPNSIVAVSTRISWRSSTPLVGVTWDNSTKSNFAQIQLCPFPLYIYLN